MENRIKAILILSILCIVFFINFDNKVFEHVINLIYYCQYYVIVGLLIVLLWILFKNKLIRVLTCPIGVYYFYHFMLNFIEIFNPELKDEMYTTRNINYLLSITLAIALFIIPFFSYLKRFVLWIKSKLNANEKILYD